MFTCTLIFQPLSISTDVFTGRLNTSMCCTVTAVQRSGHIDDCCRSFSSSEKIVWTCVHCNPSIIVATLPAVCLVCLVIATVSV